MFNHCFHIDNIGVGQSREIFGGGPVKSIKIWDEALEDKLDKAVNTLIL